MSGILLAASLVACLALAPAPAMAASAAMSVTTVQPTIRSLLGPGDAVSIPDAVLADIINSSLGFPEGTSLTRSDLESVRLVSGSGVSDLTGLEYATNLEFVALFGVGDHGIRDLSPLRALTKISYLNLGNNHISDLGPLSGMTALEQLQLDHNLISDLRPLRGLSSTFIVTLNDNQISDITGLEGLLSVRVLLLGKNQIEDASALAASLNNGASVSLDANRLRTLQAFVGTGAWVSAPDQQAAGGTLFVPQGATTFTVTDATAGMVGSGGNQVIPVDYGSFPDLSIDGMSVTWSELGEANLTLGVDFTDEVGFFSGQLTFAIAPVVFTSPALHDATRTQSYTHTFAVTTGFDHPNFTLERGSVPGLALSPDGVLSGIPASEGSWPLTIRSTDAGGNSLTQSVVLTVLAEALIPGPPDVPEPPVPPVPEPPVPLPPASPPGSSSPMANSPIVPSSSPTTLAATGSPAASWLGFAGALLLIAGGLVAGGRTLARQRRR